MRPYILVLTDSRGRDLEAFLRLHTPPIPAESILSVHVKLGATLEDLFVILRRETRTIEARVGICKIVVVLSAGICNLTTKTGNKRARNLQISYSSTPAKINSIRSTLDEIRTYCRDRGYAIVITTILLADLIGALDFNIRKRSLLPAKQTVTRSILTQQQAQLLADIKDLNLYIQHKFEPPLNLVVNSTKTLQRLATVTTTRRDEPDSQGKKKGKKVKPLKYKYEDLTQLTDGVHPSERVKTSLFKKIRDALIFSLVRKPDTSRAENSQSEEEESGRFK